ncbi:MAG: tetratricopeptide repeat protein [Nitrospirales bacterium]
MKLSDFLSCPAIPRDCATGTISFALCLTLIVGGSLFPEFLQAQISENDTHESEPQAEEHLRLGIDFYLTNELEIAIDEFREAARIRPGYADAHYNLGVVLAKSGDLTGAIAAWSQAQRLHPSDLPAQYHLSALVSYNFGVALLRQGQLDQAMTEWASALRIQPDFAEAHYAEGLGYLAKGNAIQAIVKFQQALSWRANWPMAHHQLGVAFYETRDFPSAEQAWRKALELQPQLAKAHSNLGFIQLLEGQTNSAIDSFQQAIALDPDLPEAYVNLGTALYSKGEWRAVLKPIQTVLDFQPQLLPARQLLGATWANLRQWGKATSEWRAALQQYPPESTSATLHYNIGLALMMMGDVRGAIGEFRQALTFRREWADAHFQLGTVSILAKEWPAGLQHFQKAVELKPTWAQAFFSLGKVHYHMGSVARAIESLQEAIRLEPRFADASYHLGVILRAHNRSEEAIAPLLVAAKAGIENAQGLLASMYANGSGIDQNIPMAMIWWARISSTGSLTETGVQAKERLSQLRRQFIGSQLPSAVKEEILTGFLLIRQSLRQTIRNVDGYSYDQSLGQQLAQHKRMGEAIPVLIQEALTLDETARSELERLYLNGVSGKLQPYDGRILSYFLETAQEQNVQSCNFLRKISQNENLPDSANISAAKHACRL